MSQKSDSIAKLPTPPKSVDDDGTLTVWHPAHTVKLPEPDALVFQEVEGIGLVPVEFERVQRQVLAAIKAAAGRALRARAEAVAKAKQAAKAADVK